METEQIKNWLLELSKLQTALASKGGPTEDGELFEEILSLQEDILKSFGLLTNPDNEKLIFFKEPATDFELIERVSQLEKVATAYLLSDAKPELHTLREAQEQQHDPMYVFPELKISTNIYTLFIYNKILLLQKDNLKNILNELKFVSNSSDILDAIGRLEQGTIENEHEVAESLEKSGVRYYQKFYIHNSNLLSDDDY